MTRPLAALLALLTATFPLAATAGGCGGWNTELFFAFATDADIRACLAAGADPNAKDGDDITPLHYAAASRWNHDVVAAPVDADVRPMLRDKWGSPPLH